MKFMRKFFKSIANECILFCHPELDSGSDQRSYRTVRPMGEIPVVTGMTNVCNEGKMDNNHNGLIALSPYRLNAFDKAAFTMAEILLSLTIIGVVAAITLPSLTGNINERTWNTQRKALYARMSQAIALMPALNGFGTISGQGTSSAVDTATETFIASGLSKVLKINNICDNEHFEDCGILTSYTDMAGMQKTLPTTLHNLNSYFSYVAYSNSSYSTLNTKAVAFETQNGESIVAYYNQNCRTEFLNEESLTNLGNVFGFPEATMCVNFIYDLNGSKGPNTVGKDIGFITVFNSMDSIVVAPMPSSPNNAGEASWTSATKLCTDADSESRLPNINELSAMMINMDIINLSRPSLFWSSSVFNSERAWNVETQASYGYRISAEKSHMKSARCIKR